MSFLGPRRWVACPGLNQKNRGRIYVPALDTFDFFLKRLNFFIKFSFLVLMHNLLDDVECTVEKEYSLSNFRS